MNNYINIQTPQHQRPSEPMGGAQWDLLSRNPIRSSDDSKTLYIIDHIGRSLQLSSHEVFEECYFPLIMDVFQIDGSPHVYVGCHDTSFVEAMKEIKILRADKIYFRYPISFNY